ncbi:MAG: hypothetical protein KGI00_04335 [Candidatus Micrarchaeota archaeon]|nr:hypothetical protein [Candidatus Micrarchaeota archaeon]MDE1849927.1 hypothetical protein [Candidatus Micrarchaeota archaeon]
MKINLGGKTRKVLYSMIKEGYASTESEAIRLAIFNFWKSRIKEEISVKKKLDRIDRQIKEGKRKVLNSKEALGVYAKYVK